MRNEYILSDMPALFFASPFTQNILQNIFSQEYPSRRGKSFLNLKEKFFSWRKHYNFPDDFAGKLGLQQWWAGNYSLMVCLAVYHS